MRCVRIWFEKTGDAVFISHLDLQRCFIRALRRARLDVAYTEGFHPHAHINFAQPLPLGVAGLRESVDIKLSDDSITNSQICEMLAAVMPGGVRVTAVADPMRKQKEIAFAQYKMNLLCRGDPAAWWRMITAVESIPAHKTGKRGKQSFFDVKQYVFTAEFNCAARSDTAAIRVILPLGSALNINPFTFLDALRGVNEGFDISDVTREKILTGSRYGFT